MRYTVKAHAKPEGFAVNAEAGIVRFDGLTMLPHEAAMLADALSNCAESAEDKAAEHAAKLVPVEA